MPVCFTLFGPKNLPNVPVQSGGTMLGLLFPSRRWSQSFFSMAQSLDSPSTHTRARQAAKPQCLRKGSGGFVGGGKEGRRGGAAAESSLFSPKNPPIIMPLSSRDHILTFSPRHPPTTHHTVQAVPPSVGRCFLFCLGEASLFGERTTRGREVVSGGGS